MNKEKIELLQEIERTAHPESRHHFSFDGTFFVCQTTFSCPAILAPRDAADYMNHLLDKLNDYGTLGARLTRSTMKALRDQEEEGLA